LPAKCRSVKTQSFPLSRSGESLYRRLNFGGTTAVREFSRERVHWVERKSAATEQATAILDVIVAIVMTRLNDRSIPELCAIGDITLEEFTQSVAYKEIFGQGRLEGRQEGELGLTLRQLRRRCGELGPEQVSRVSALPLERLEALAEALLDFPGAADLDIWLGAAV
jgi:hypothetical protein